MLFSFDRRWHVAIPGNEAATLHYIAEAFVALTKEAIQKRGQFSVALSGGSTPKKIFELLVSPAFASKVEWSRVLLFWSDERSVSPESSESNYHMAMQSLEQVPLNPSHIFRMVAEEEIEKNALEYERTIFEKLGTPPHFDLIMLGVGEDGHTASLFPHSKGLFEEKRLVIANYSPSKESWRMTFTYPALLLGRVLHIYALGESKAKIIETLFTAPYQPENLPVQKVGTAEQQALWILDERASQNLRSKVILTTI